jgi:hypothetical protein
MGNLEGSYIELVAEKEGWANVPPGARTSLYENPNYQAVPFAKMTLDSILSADPNNSTVEPSPYVGIQFAAIPEFAGIATEVSQEFSAVYAGQQTVEEALGQSAGDHQRRHGSSGLPLSLPSRDRRRVLHRLRTPLPDDNEYAIGRGTSATEDLRHGDPTLHDQQPAS